MSLSNSSAGSQVKIPRNLSRNLSRNAEYTRGRSALELLGALDIEIPKGHIRSSKYFLAVLQHLLLGAETNSHKFLFIWWSSVKFPRSHNLHRRGSKTPQDQIHGYPHKIGSKQSLARVSISENFSPTELISRILEEFCQKKIPLQ